MKTGECLNRKLCKQIQERRNTALRGSVAQRESKLNKTCYQNGGEGGGRGWISDVYLGNHLGFFQHVSEYLTQNTQSYFCREPG